MLEKEARVTGGERMAVGKCGLGRALGAREGPWAPLGVLSRGWRDLTQFQSRPGCDVTPHQTDSS